MIERSFDTCFVYGSVKAWDFTSMLQVTLERNGRIRECEFLRPQIRIEWTSTDTALIEIPKCFLPIFCLWDFVLTEKEVERRRNLAAMHNAPYLPRAVERKPEIIGGCRI